VKADNAGLVKVLASRLEAVGRPPSKGFHLPGRAVVERANYLRRLLLRLSWKPGMECASTGERLRHEAEEE